MITKISARQLFLQIFDRFAFKNWNVRILLKPSLTVNHFCLFPWLLSKTQTRLLNAFEWKYEQNRESIGSSDLTERSDVGRLVKVWEHAFKNQISGNFSCLLRTMSYRNLCSLFNVWRHVSTLVLHCCTQGKTCHLGIVNGLVWIEKKNHLFLGCSVSLEIVGLMAAAWNIPILTPLGSSGVLANTQEYRTLTRLSSDLAKHGQFLVHLLRHFNWTDVVIIHDNVSVVFDLRAKSYQIVFEAAGVRTTNLPYRFPHDHRGVLQAASRVARGIFFIFSLWACCMLFESLSQWWLPRL